MSINLKQTNMKSTNFFRLMVVALATVFFVSCGDDDKTDPDPNPSGGVTITLDKTTAEVTVNGSVKLTATVTPAGSAVTWSSEDSNIASVINGTVVGKAKGTTNIVATSGDAQAKCAVTVVEGTGPGGAVDFSKIACLQGSNYYTIVLSEGARTYLGNKIIQDLGPDGNGGKDAAGKLTNGRNLWYWDGTIDTGTPGPLNSFGEMDGYICLKRTAAADWAGAGFAIAPPSDFPAVQPLDLTDIYAHPEQYYFHVALKTTDPSFSVTLTLGDGVQNGKHEVKFTFGDVQGDNKQTPRAAITKDGMWHEFEIPCTEFIVGDAMMYQKPFYDTNILVMLLFPSSGVTLHLDAAFFYKK